MKGIVIYDGNENLLMVSVILFAVAGIMHLYMRKRQDKSIQ